MDLRKCLHITNRIENEDISKNNPRYDKVHQTRWVMIVICDKCKAMWNFRRILTTDKMMICYKGTYSPIRQYMPDIP